MKIAAHITKEQEDLLTKAAQVAGFDSLSDFIISTAEMKAKEILASEGGIIELSSADQIIFFDTLLYPPQPNEDLIKAAKEYRALTQ